MLPRHLLGLICPIEHGDTCTVLSRRHALDIQKLSIEVREIIEANLEGDICHAIIGLGQQLAGFFDPQ